MKVQPPITQGNENPFFIGSENSSFLNGFAWNVKGRGGSTTTPPGITGDLFYRLK